MKNLFRLSGIFCITVIGCFSLSQKNITIKYDDHLRHSKIFLRNHQKCLDSILISDYYNSHKIKKTGDFYIIDYKGRCGTECSEKHQIILQETDQRIVICFHLISLYEEYSFSVDTNHLNRKYVENKIKSEKNIQHGFELSIDDTFLNIKKNIKFYYDQDTSIFYNDSIFLSGNFSLVSNGKINKEIILNEKFKSINIWDDAKHCIRLNNIWYFVDLKNKLLKEEPF